MWILSLLVSVAAVRTLHQGDLPWSPLPAVPEVNAVKNSKGLCLLLAPILLSHLQLIIVPMEHCTWFLLTISFILLDSVSKVLVP